MMIDEPELADGLPTWERFLARLDADSAPTDPDWVRVRATTVDTIAWFESLPPDAPPVPGAPDGRRQHPQHRPANWPGVD